MFSEEDRVAKPPKYEIGQPLEELSVAELEETISLLYEEIERLSKAKDQKSSHMGAAEALFSKHK